MAETMQKIKLMDKGDSSMKKKRKWLVPLTLILVLGVTFALLYFEGGFFHPMGEREQDGNGNVVSYWHLDWKGTLTISGGRDVSSYFASLAGYRHGAGAPDPVDGIEFEKYVRRLIIGEGVESIGEYAFINCRRLREVTLPESLRSVGKYAFKGTSLRTLHIGAGVKELGARAFPSCCTDLVLDENNPYFRLEDGLLMNKEKTEIMMYFETDGRAAFTVPAGVTRLAPNSFANLEKLKDLTVPEGVTEIGDHAFAYCGILETVTLPDSVLKLGEGAFDSCPKLRNVTLPQGLKTFPAYIFTNCEGLKTVEIPSSVTEIGYNAFFASGITEITVPEGVTAIGENAFYSCKALTYATLPGTISGTLTNVFDSCDNLTDVYFGGSPEAWQALQANLQSQTKVHFK